MKKRIFKYFIGFALLISGVYSLLYGIAEPIADHKYFNPDGFMVIAHRGGRSLGPENTLFTFQRAAELGVDVLEIDLHSTRGGKLVVIHDDTVNRTTDGKGAVSDFTLAEIKRLDAGFRWSPDNGRTYPMRGKGLTVPTLAEVFTSFPKMRINIEIKEQAPEVTAVLCDLIQKYHQAEHVMIASFDTSQLKRFRSKCPQVATSVGAKEAVLFYGLQWAYLDNIYSPPAQAMQVPYRYGSRQVVTPRFLEAAHARNMRVNVWTINDTEQMRDLINLGVDGIMTDYPQRLLELLKREGKTGKISSDLR